MLPDSLCGKNLVRQSRNGDGKMEMRGFVLPRKEPAWKTLLPEMKKTPPFLLFGW
jgi:hypothetical protein